MSNRLIEIFDDKKTVGKIQRRLPYLFQIAEIESSRAGKIGMEVGSLRERIIVALLIYKFGENSVETELPITEPEVDVKLFGRPLSIKTITGNNFSGVKLIWTVDAEKAKEFQESYYPKCDVLLVQINWGGEGGFYYIPVSAQRRLFQEMGRDQYIKLPRAGTNPRGVEISRAALTGLIYDRESRCIRISWQKRKIRFNPYKRWIDMWVEEEDEVQS